MKHSAPRRGRAVSPASPAATAAVLALLLTAVNTSAETVVNLGSIEVIDGPGDLELDAEIVYAVNFDNGGNTHTISGVDFVSDLQPPAGARFVGPNNVTPWQTKPEFGDTADEDALEEVFADIRWANTAPGMDQTLEAHLDVEVGQNYLLQLLISGNHQEDRVWDIEIEGAEAVDEITSLGINTNAAIPVSAVYSLDTAIVYRYEFEAADGVFDLRMGNFFGDNDGGDRNPIWQGLVLSKVVPPTAPSDIELSETEFAATLPLGGTVGALSAVDPNFRETFTYALVPGEGDDGNALFQIEGDVLVTGASFAGAAGRDFSVRVRVTDSTDRSFEKVFLLSVRADADADDLLDTWELDFAGNLEDLTGLANGPGPGAGSGDFDGDSVADAAEFTLGTNPVEADTDEDGLGDGNEVAAGTDPLVADTDEDGLTDGEEIALGTDPLRADTDGDGLSDGDEVAGNNASGFTSDPTLADTDDDSWEDDFEVSMGNDPRDPADVPVFVDPPFTQVNLGSVHKIRGPGDLDLEGDIVYAINFDNGGLSRTVNGVTFVPDNPPPAGATFVGPNEVTPWQTKPEFGDTADDNELEELFANIRWANSGAVPPQVLEAHLDVDPGQRYKLQLLISGNHVETRNWDIRIDGADAVDELSSNGFVPRDTYSRGTAVVYRYIFTAPDDRLDVLMGDFFGNNNLGDRNPIWQGLILEKLSSPPTALLVTDVLLLNSLGAGEAVAALATETEDPIATYVYSLVPGDGVDDADNGKFAVEGERLVTGDHDFSAEAEGATFAVRLRTTDELSGLFLERAFVLTLQTDGDADRLPDTWEEQFAPGAPGDLTGLEAGPGPGAGSGDFDGDGLADADEFARGTSPVETDSDGDGVGDGDEVAAGTDPTNPDTDGDGLDDGGEAAAGTDPRVADSDGDGLTDGEEVLTHGSNPLAQDSDGDGFNDRVEVGQGTDPNDPESVPAVVPVILLDSNTGAESWLTPGDWDSNALPAANGEYTVPAGNLTLQSPVGDAPVFGGLSLTIAGGGSKLNLRHRGEARVDDLRIDGGRLCHGTAATLGLAGNLALQSPSGLQFLQPNGTLQLAATLSGAGGLTVIGDASNTLELSGDNTAFTGGWSVENVALAAARAGSLGPGDIVLDNASLDADYDIVSPAATLHILGEDTRVALDQNHTFGAMVLGAFPLPLGVYDRGAFIALDPTLGDVFSDGGGSITVVGFDPGDVDSDGDGISDQDELRAGTDPLDASSIFQAAAFTAGAAGGEVGFSFPAAAGTAYRIDFSPSLAPATWTEVESITAAGSTVDFSDSEAARVGGRAGFYRVVVVAP